MSTIRRRLPWPTPSVRTGRALAAVGAVWSLLFAATHFYWAAGGRLGVSANAGPIGQRPLFLAYDLVSAVIFVTAAVIGLILATGGTARWLLTLVTWGAVLALLRGFGGIIQDIITLAMGHSPGVGVIYDVWFAVAGVIFFSAVRAVKYCGESAETHGR